MVCSHTRGLFSIKVGNKVYTYFITYISVYLAYYELVRAKLVRVISVLLKAYCPISDKHDK